MSDLCVCIRDVISEFNSEIEGSLAFWGLMLFLCSILFLMCSWSSLHVECILPFGMLCLSAWRMMFVKIKTPIYTGPETDTHAHCIPGRVAGRNDLSYIVNSGKTHCK